VTDLPGCRCGGLLRVALSGSDGQIRLTPVSPAWSRRKWFSSKDAVYIGAPIGMAIAGALVERELGTRAAQFARCAE